MSDRPEDPNSEAGNPTQERRAAADALRRTSLAADPSHARRKAGFYAGAAGVLALCMAGVFMMRQQPAAPTNGYHDDQPRIAEDAPKSGKLADTPDKPASALAASAPAPASAVDPQLLAEQRAEEQRRLMEAEAKRKREEEMQHARLHSALFAEQAQAGDSSATGADAGLAASGAQGDGKDTARHGRGPNDTNSMFAHAVQDEDDSAERATLITNRQCKIEPGRILEGHLVPRIVSDLPGSVTIMLDQDTYGEEGRIPLMPWGTRIVGQPNSNVRKGQDRTFIATATAYRPDGVKVRLDSPVADQLGSAGLDGDVNNHIGQILGMSVVLSLLGAGASTAGAAGYNGANSLSTYRDNVQSSLANSSQELLGAYANIPPTLTNPQGSRVRIQVEHELDFSDFCKPAGEEDQ
ncbi:TrbI/VirB10 family protein [Trinickia violacea]|uniref:TrbI/VirB10 family protein n=1 Tax=Trinickia violacea TaxID=2571746 RepID=A0A4P8J3K8_9BURK|nr:TrbI/VirB10 family protein [Trinickia violacea]QCP55125.1 TrbI/VirB10 family protein [Trinickia violacea]